MMKKHNLYLLVFSLIGTGCAMNLEIDGPYGTPYQENRALNMISGGYEEEQIDKGVYKIRYLGNAFTSPEKTLSFWRKRASELCQAKGYEENFEHSKITKSATYVGTIYFDSTFEWPQVVGIAKCNSTNS